MIRRAGPFLFACSLGACTNGDGETVYFLPTLLIGGLLLAVGIPFWRFNASERRRYRERIAKLGLHDVVPAGQYISGHPDESERCTVDVGFTSESYVFVDRVGVERFRLERDAPSEIEIVDASKTVTTSKESVSLVRVAALGAVGLAFPKRTTTSETVEKFIVAIGWTYNGVAMTLCFAFGNSRDANVFAGALAKTRSNRTPAA